MKFEFDAVEKFFVAMSFAALGMIAAGQLGANGIGIAPALAIGSAITLALSLIFLSDETVPTSAVNFIVPRLVVGVRIELRNMFAPSRQFQMVWAM